MANCVVHKVKGPHPAGNPGVQIHHIDPITAIDRVWTIDTEAVANIGASLMQGRSVFTKTVAVAGHGIDEQYRKYYRTKAGAAIKSLIPQIDDDANRLISGDVLTGDKVNYDQSIGYFHNTLTIIPEGREYAMFGWLPFTRNNIPSLSGASLSGLMPNKKYEVNTNMNGEERALVVTGEMEAVVPMDLYPMQLLKACMTGNIEDMESLGIYEVAPEDFALVDYTNTSKLEAQQTIRQGLDIMITEVG
jgi:Na+-transporting NADH:ubiquinone oxidoreductase subunit A